MPPTRKRRGEAAQAAFLARATALNSGVLIPWGDSERYDNAVDFGRGLFRVQIKSATAYAENPTASKPPEPTAASTPAKKSTSS